MRGSKTSCRPRDHPASKGVILRAVNPAARRQDHGAGGTRGKGGVEGLRERRDEVREFGHGRVELLNMNEGTVGRLTLEPGWRWSVDVKPIAGTEWCEAPHFQYVISGRLHVRMKDGSEFDLGPGVGLPSTGRPRRLGRRRQAGDGGGLVRRHELREALTPHRPDRVRRGPVDGLSTGPSGCCLTRSSGPRSSGCPAPWPRPRRRPDRPSGSCRCGGP